MIKTLTACTTEIDERESAVADILEQLDLKTHLRKNSVGIMTCYSEFIDSGVAKAICDSLPFDVVGCTTIANASCGEVGQLMLCISVLTSDTIAFSAAVSGSLYEGVIPNVQASYEAALKELPQDPSMILAFAPLIQHVSGEQILNELDRVTQGIPIFGTVAVDHLEDYRTTQVIFNGEGYAHGMAMALIAGEMEPTFYMASLSNEKIRKQKAIITSSNGNVVKEVNEMPALKYLEFLGLSTDSDLIATTVPFVIDYNDGTVPVARSIYALTPEGYAVCGGEMPEESTLSIGSMDYEDVLVTTAGVVNEAKKAPQHHGVLMFSCICRFFALGSGFTDEMEHAGNGIHGLLPYQFAYSGGEICPVKNEQGEWVNRFHNATIVACIF